jgi:hypothetical protein
MENYSDKSMARPGAARGFLAIGKRTGNFESGFRPVIGKDGGCLGHLIASARGWRAFGRNDELVGTFETEDAAVTALVADVPSTLVPEQKNECTAVCKSA